MKKIKFIAMAMMAMAGMMLASCMGDSYADPDMVETIPAPPYGNNLLKEKNVVTIAQLKSDYKTTITGGGYKLIDKPMMIKGYITGNDISGNLYQQVALQDATGAILVDINGGGLYGYLPVGQEILIDLNGLYIGSKGKQAQIGGIYTNLKTGATYVGKMDRPTWQKHFKLLDEPDASNVKAEVFDLSKATDATYLDENAGKLMTIKGVKFTSANGKTVWAANDETSKQYLKDAESGQWLSSNTIMVYTSGYARFANAILPEGAFDITGIFTRYNNTWQIIIRNTDDLSPVTLDKGGTLEDPYTVTKALEIINAGTFTTDKVYTTGIICEVNDIDTGTYGNATYSISVDGKVGEGKTLKVFRGYNIGGEKWTEETKGTLAVGKKVVILGALTLYNGVAEINSGNQLISIK
jgi:DNA/RNA endonuclease YhcR with UshA esterase domain